MKSTSEFNRNNLDWLRLIFALIVTLDHGHGLTNVSAFPNFSQLIPGHFAVKPFFVISGLLVYRSYINSSSIASYFEKRLRRIYPAYFAIVVLAAISLWPLSTLPFSQYFGVGFWKYIGANLLFLNFLAPTLPGVFTSNINTAVNGSLWTLKTGVAFYLSVPVIHYVSGRLGTRKTMAAIFCFSCLWKYGFAWLAYTHSARAMFALEPRNLYSQLEAQFPGQLLYFIAGILLFLYFDELKLHFRMISSITVGLFLVDYFFMGGYLDVFWISGLVFVFGFWCYFGNSIKFGDLSYGVYLVHWPILQVMVAIGLTSLNPAIFVMASLLLTFVVSLLMWNLVEKRFLTGSSHFSRATGS